MHKVESNLTEKHYVNLLRIIEYDEGYRCFAPIFED